MELNEKTLSESVKFDGNLIKVSVAQVELVNGKKAKREVVRHRGGVCIAALTENDELLFVKQFRYPFSKVLLELPAGTLEEGKDPLEEGKRELKEETGAVGEDYRQAFDRFGTVPDLSEGQIFGALTPIGRRGGAR